MLVNEMTVAENIALPLAVTNHTRQEIDQRVADLLKLVGLEDKANLFPTQLSGGEAGRVGIARALALAPEVIFADEPTGNLDPNTSLEIAQILKKINQLGTTLILATHDPIVVDLFESDRVIKLERGKIVADSRPKDVEEALKKVKSLTQSKSSFLSRLFKKKNNQESKETVVIKVKETQSESKKPAQKKSKKTKKSRKKKGSKKTS
jgi:ABC-type methionine transport system ATPase subunit